jgi:uncharacterized membrane protein AbrB (regulator of aidB expression)
MTGAFFRLAFITCCASLVFGLVMLAAWQGVPVALIVGVLGVICAVVLSEDWQLPADDPANPRGEQRARAGSHRPWRRTGPYEGEG